MNPAISRPAEEHHAGGPLVTMPTTRRAKPVTTNDLRTRTGTGPRRQSGTRALWAPRGAPRVGLTGERQAGRAPTPRRAARRRGAAASYSATFSGQFASSSSRSHSSSVAELECPRQRTPSTNRRLRRGPASRSHSYPPLYPGPGLAGPGAGDAPAQAKKGWRRSTLTRTDGLQRMLRGKARGAGARAGRGRSV